MPSCGNHFTDVFGKRVVPWWKPCPEQDSPQRTIVSIAAHAQLGSLSFLSTEPPIFEESIPVVRFAENISTGSAAASACLTHGRLVCRVHPRRGDALPDFDLSSMCLSTRGVCLTKDAVSQNALRDTAEKRAYTSPFWLSLDDLHMLNAYGRLIPASLGVCNAAQDRDRLLRLYGESSKVAFTVVNDRGEASRVANLSEIQGSFGTVSPRSQKLAFYHFRKYNPINVRTRCSFDAAVEDRLRAESINSGRWCSVWGTPADFAACGCPALEGALGVHVFDTLGNNVFLTNAMCTSNPAVAYTAAFPSRAISFFR